MLAHAITTSMYFRVSIPRRAIGGHCEPDRRDGGVFLTAGHETVLAQPGCIKPDATKFGFLKRAEASLVIVCIVMDRDLLTYWITK